MVSPVTAGASELLGRRQILPRALAEEERRAVPFDDEQQRILQLSCKRRQCLFCRRLRALFANSIDLCSWPSW